MIYIIISIIGLLVIVALFTYSSKSKTKTEEPPVVAPPADCCGAHAICEKGLKKIDEKIEYFDDEELDQYTRRKTSAPILQWRQRCASQYSRFTCNKAWDCKAEFTCTP